MIELLLLLLLLLLELLQLLQLLQLVLLRQPPLLVHPTRSQKTVAKSINL